MILRFTSTKKEKINTLLIRNGFSNSNIYQLIHQKHVLVNSTPVLGRNFIINENDNIEIILNDEVNNLKENSTPVDIVYEDEYFLVVNKPYNLDVEPSLHTETNNLSSMITFYFNKNNIKSKVHLVNRLDKLTTGLVIVAKNRYIKNLFCNTKIIKKYICLVQGVTPLKGVIINQIKKSDDSSKRIVVEKGGKSCLTTYKRLKVIDNNSLLEVRIFTGRTHQIRTSFAHLGYPLVNDPLYNNEFNGDMYLCACSLKFKHPILSNVLNITIK